MPDKLNKKPVSDFTVTPDVQRIMGMGASPDGFNPAVNPIVDPAARSYAARIQERTKIGAGTLKGKTPPLGHAPSPDKAKMEAIAGLSTLPRPSFTSAPEEPVPDAKPTSQSSGVGAAYQANHAVTQGRTDGPVTLREANQMSSSRTLSDDTVRALEEMNKSVKKAQDVEKEAPAPLPAVAQETKKEIESSESSLGISPIDSFDFGSLADIRSTLMSTKRKESIEARLTPLDISDLVIKREITQTIPIIPDKLEVTLRTFNQKENLWILKYIYDFSGSALYVQELINTCRLVCGLVAINGAFLPDHRQNIGQYNEQVSKEDFEKKFSHVASFPVQLVADFSVQSMWFQDRVDKLFTVDAIKNG
jgi:hypothetical protein